MKKTDLPVSRDGLVLKRQAYYCEENVWQLNQEPFLATRPRHVVFISNRERVCPMWNQRAGRGKPILWDYHVILLVGDPLEVWDVDTLLGIPVEPAEYLERSFHPGLPEMYLPSFRIVPADVFVEVFASDRSHMREEDGRFKKPPPSWPLIGKAGARSTLMDFVDMEKAFVGEVVTYAGIWGWFGER